MQEGAFVVIESGDWQFYGLVTDLQLGATDPRFADEQSEKRLPPVWPRLLHGQTLYTNLEVLPALMLDRGPDLTSPEYPAWRRGAPRDPRPLPVKTVPAAPRRGAPGRARRYRRDLRRSGREGNFVIGYTREQGHPVCI